MISIDKHQERFDGHVDAGIVSRNELQRDISEGTYQSQFYPVPVLFRCRRVLQHVAGMPKIIGGGGFGGGIIREMSISTGALKKPSLEINTCP